MSFASPMPSDAELSEYNAAYFENAHGGTPTSRSIVAFFSGISRLRLAFLQQFLRRYRIHIDSALELGPGPGYFARGFLESEPRCAYFAIETDKSCHNQLRNSGVRLIDNLEAVQTDLVVMCHVLEHVPDPVNFIRRSTEGLKSGGALFIEVPCRDWEHKTLDEPHILFFDKQPMRTLLHRLGFKDVEVSYHGVPIKQLNRTSWIERKWMSVRTRLINIGIVMPFAKVHSGMESLSNPLERALVSPCLAHRESIEPAWWLRAVARKA